MADKTPKPQAVQTWLEEYEQLNKALADHRLKRSKMIFHLHDRGCGVSYIARVFDMQQQNVSHIIRHRAKYEQGLSAPKDADLKEIGDIFNV